MNSQRLILFLVFSVSVLFLWEAWQRDKQAPVVAGKPAVTVQTATGATVGSTPNSQGLLPSLQKIQVKTDLFAAQIDTRGGDLRELVLLNHGDTTDKNKPFVLLQSHGGAHTYVAQSGLIGAQLPNHTTTFQAEKTAYTLEQGQQSLSVTLRTPATDSVIVSKTYTFKRGSYVVDVSYTLQNTGAQALNAGAYFQLVRDGQPSAGESRSVSVFTGPAVYSEAKKYQKIEFKKLDKHEADFVKQASDGWVAMVQHYFVSAWLPAAQQARENYAETLGNGLYRVGVKLPVVSIPAGGKAEIAMPLFVGPQEQDKLAAAAKGLELVVDYGWLTVFATPLFWVLQHLHSLVQNWGVAIILLTVLVKGAFFPLSAASYRSMAKMKAVAPRLEQIKAQHGDDRQKMHQAMMEMYKTEKINPLGGCLPMLVQIPVFIALYWVLLGSVELRHAPFFGWIHDLSVQDPYYILPIIMGASMWFQSRLNPTPPDPVQAKVMQIMPIVMSVFFLWFPAGLVLYWVVNNLLSIAQQWQINRMLEPAKSV